MTASVVQGGPYQCFLSKEAFGYIVDSIDSVSTEDWIPKVCNEKLKVAIEELRPISHYVTYGDMKYFNALLY